MNAFPELTLSREDGRERLEQLIALSGCAPDDARELSARAIERFGAAEVLATLPIDELCRFAGERTGLFIKLVAYITSRRVIDGFKLGVPHTDEEVYKMAIATFLGLSKETLYLMSFDKQGRVIAFDFVSEGTVNSSQVYPRMIVEAALARDAYSVILAHNHPRGSITPSEEDFGSTMRAAEVLRGSGIRLRSHIIAAERECAIMTPGEDYFLNGSMTVDYYKCAED